jgi:hypothetical protein
LPFCYYHNADKAKRAGTSLSKSSIRPALYMRWFCGLIILALLSLLIFKTSPSAIEFTTFQDNKIIYNPQLYPYMEELWVNSNCVNDKISLYVGWDYWQDACNRRYSNWL